MVVGTPRTLLRYFKEGDAADLYGYLSLPETYEYEPGCPISFERAWAMARARQGGKDSEGSGRKEA